MLSDSLRSIGEKMSEYNAPSALAQIFALDTSSGETGTNQLWLLIGVTAAAIAGAFILLERRDV
jgi:hypothetical protein